MKKFVNLLWLISIILFSVQSIVASGRNSLNFLTIPVGAKPASLGGAFTSMANDVNSIYWNPAGLGKVKFKEFIFMHNNYIYDFKHEYLAYCQYFSKLNGTLGFDINLFNAGTFEKMYIDGGLIATPGGTYNAKDIAVGISYGKNFNRVNFGTTFKYINSKIDNAKATAIALDIGFIFDISSNNFPAKIGIVMQNFGNRIKYDFEKESLPLQYKLGLSTNLRLNQSLSLIPTVDAIYSDDGKKIYINVGNELNISNIFFIRCGLNSMNDIGNGFTFGVGSNISKFNFDYSYEKYNILNAAHRFSLGYRF